MEIVLSHKITFAITGLLGLWGSRRGWRKECVSTIVIVALLLTFLTDGARLFLIRWANKLSKSTLVVIQVRFDLKAAAEAYERLPDLFTEANAYLIFLIMLLSAYFFEWLVIRPRLQWGAILVPPCLKLRDRIAGAVLGCVNAYLTIYFLMVRGVFPEPETRITFLSRSTREFVSAKLPIVILGFVGVIIVFGLLVSPRDQRRG